MNHSKFVKSVRYALITAQWLQGLLAVIFITVITAGSSLGPEVV